ncbi:MAG: peptidoglycan DD-metalloendopeptidase family protein [Acetobacterales bacterium]
MALALAAPPVQAADDNDRDRLREIEREIETRRREQQQLSAKEKELALETARLRAQLVATARRIRDHEAAAETLEQRIIELQRRDAEVNDAIDTHRRQHDRVVGALMRLARRPVETFMLLPAPEKDRLHGAALLGAAVSTLEEEAKSLRKSLDSLAGVRTELDAQRRKLAAVRDDLDTERARVSDLLNRKRALRASTAEEQKSLEKEAAELAARADDLRDLLKRLEASRQAREALPRHRPPAPASLPRPAIKPEAPSTATASLAPPARTPDAQPPETRPFTKARGALPMPVRGSVVARYGESDGLGQTFKGIRIRASQDAQVVSPYDGQVVFAGPFRGYGLLLIVNHGEGYHSLLAGADELNVEVGQWVLAGEPVGRMGQPAKGRPELYVELRHEGQPVNPLPWMSAGKDKVSG